MLFVRKRKQYRSFNNQELQKSIQDDGKDSFLFAEDCNDGKIVSQAPRQLS